MQTTSFIDKSIEAGILLGGNGAPRAMPVSLALSHSQFGSVFPSRPSHSISTLPLYPSLQLFTRLSLLTILFERARSKSLFSNEVDGVALLPYQVLFLRQGSSCLQRVYSAA